MVVNGLISSIVIVNTLVENWDHIIFPNSSILFPYVPTHNEFTLTKYFTLTMTKVRKEKTKIFRNIFNKKMTSPLNVQANKRKYEKPFKSISWSGSDQRL